MLAYLIRMIASAAEDGSLILILKTEVRMVLDKIALALTIIGALNWGSIGIFKFDVVAWIFGGTASVGARVVYTLVALAGIWCISLLFRSREAIEGTDDI